MHWSEKLRVFACLCVLMTLSACGDDSGTSANNDKDTELAEVSNSSKALSSSSAKSVSYPRSVAKGIHRAIAVWIPSALRASRMTSKRIHLHHRQRYLPPSS